MMKRKIFAAAACSMLLFSTGCTSNPAPEQSNQPVDGVVIKRSAYGIPNVYADSTSDLFRGYGYTVATDRLFQMEMAKRAVLGTSAEVLGKDYVDIDKATLANFNPDSIRKQLKELPAEDAAIFEGYAAGFNQRVDEVMAKKSELLPKEFTDYGFEPSEFTAYDVVMIWVGTMANRFSNTSSEIQNLQMLTELTDEYGNKKGKELFDQIYWIEDPLAPTTVPREGGNKLPKDIDKAAATGTGPADIPQASSGLLPVSADLQDDSAEVMARFGGGTWPDVQPKASNMWILGKDKTEDGSAIMLNGPQFGFWNPSYVYGVGLHGAGYDVNGNTPFAHPVVLFGTNKHISWGSTAGPMDVNDVYQEELDPKDPTRYKYKGKYQTMDSRTTTVKVKGSEDVKSTVYSTVHGTVIANDDKKNTAYSLKRSWEGYELQSLIAWIKVQKAENWEEFKEQVSKIAITNNFYYADKEGNIGYYSPGRLPIRPKNQDIRLPAKGDGSMEWEGIEDPADHPQVYNPEQGYIANWNNESAPNRPTDYGNYSVVHRVNEITSRIEGQEKMTKDDAWDLLEETSVADPNKRYLVPYLERATKDMPGDDPAKKAVEALVKWDGLSADADKDGKYDDSTAALMRSWLPVLFDEVLKPNLPKEVYTRYSEGIYPEGESELGSINPAQGTKLVYNALLGDKAGVPQTHDFFDGKNPDTILKKTFTQTVEKLRADQGEDMSAWRAPVVTNRYKPKNFIGVPQTGPKDTFEIELFLNRGTENNLVTLKGDEATLCTVAAPGQSGFIAPDGSKTKHYDDQLEMFSNFTCKEEDLNPKDIDANKESEETLK